jgi:hypothetical protein
VSSSELQGFEDKGFKAKQVQTPAKGSRKAFPLCPTDVSPYHQIIFDPYNDMADRLKVLDDEEVTRILVSLEEDMEDTTEKWVKLISDTYDQGLDAVQNFDVLFQHINEIKTTLDKHPEIPSDFDGQTLLSTVRNLTHQVTE